MTDTSTKKTITFLLSFFSSWQAQSKQRASLHTEQPAANFPLTPRVCRRKRDFIFEDMPNIVGMTPLHVMLLERSKKELYTWSLSELWSYLDKIGYDLIIDAIPQKQEPDENAASSQNI